jgi:hypothetical protein
MPDSVEASASSSAITFAAVIAALSGAAWPLSILVLLMSSNRVGQSVKSRLFAHPHGLLVGAAVTAAFFFSTWLIEKNNWKGVIFPASWYLYGIANRYFRFVGPTSIHDAILPIEFVITLLAFRSLWSRRHTASTAPTR